MKPIPETPGQTGKKLVTGFRAREGVFQNRIDVEDWVSSWASKNEKTNFLFLVTVLGYGMRSMVLSGSIQAHLRFLTID